MYFSLKWYVEAVEHHKQALAISQEIGYRQGEVSHLGNLGNAYFSLEWYAEAVEHLMQALAISQEIRDRQGEGSCLNNLGEAYHGLVRYSRLGLWSRSRGERPV